MAKSTFKRVLEHLTGKDMSGNTITLHKLLLIENQSWRNAGYRTSRSHEGRKSHRFFRTRMRANDFDKMEAP